jgi:hypothetical protein
MLEDIPLTLPTGPRQRPPHPPACKMGTPASASDSQIKSEFFLDAGIMGTAAKRGRVSGKGADFEI